MIAAAYRAARPPAGRQIFTLPRISSELRELLGEGAPASEDSCARWSHDPDDPLPLYRHGSKRLPRVVAVAEELKAWADRRWRIAAA